MLIVWWSNKKSRSSISALTKTFSLLTTSFAELRFSIVKSFFIHCESSTMSTIRWLKMIIWVTGVLTRTVVRDWRSVLPHWLSKRQSPTKVLHRSPCYSWVQIIFWLMSTMLHTSFDKIQPRCRPRGVNLDRRFMNFLFPIHLTENSYHAESTLKNSHVLLIEVDPTIAYNFLLLFLFTYHWRFCSLCKRRISVIQIRVVMVESVQKPMVDLFAPAWRDTRELTAKVCQRKISAFA